MCGLAGIFHPEGGAVDAALLRRMTAALAHRGPDGDGFHLEAGVGLGHRRLAIIDIGGGQQPMFNEDRSVVIVFNGEIYNFAALRGTLEAAGHVFRSHCDTETIIHAWELWGPDCLAHFDGMFAFALWDRNRGQLFLARDRLGKKPLYYARTPDGAFVFASELAGLAPVGTLPRRLDATAVDDFFAFGYIPDPKSIYRDIRKLPPGHALLLDADGGAATPWRYWDVACEAVDIDVSSAAVALTERLRAAVGARMIADVPLGAFLSGGVDSSAVVALAAGLRETPLSTFTISFAGAEDEAPFAAEVSRRYATEHHRELAGADYVEAARTQAAVFGEPFGDHSSVPSFSVCALARKHATVALSGDGGDEVLAGYRRYHYHLLAEAVRRHIPAPLRRGVLGQIARVYPKLDRAPRWLRAKHTLTELSLDSALGYVRTLGKIQHAQRRALFSSSFAANLDGYDPATAIAALMQSAPTEDPLRQAQYTDLHSYLPGDILTKVDRTSMANSLEVRAPMLDHRFVAWGLSLPAGLKRHGRAGKYVLKRAMEPYLSHDILYRPKQGFAVSLATQFRAGSARLRERLLGEAMRDSGLFQPARLERLIDEHAAGRFDHSGALWLLLVFEGFLHQAASNPPLRAAAVLPLAG